jgi:hypothetical protein
MTSESFLGCDATGLLSVDLVQHLSTLDSRKNEV